MNLLGSSPLVNLHSAENMGTALIGIIFVNNMCQFNVILNGTFLMKIVELYFPPAFKLWKEGCSSYF